MFDNILLLPLFSIGRAPINAKFVGERDVTYNSFVALLKEIKMLQVKCLFSFYNEDGPVYGVGFLNFNCTEFCVVTADNTKVHMYTRKHDGEENVEGSRIKKD